MLTLVILIIRTFSYIAFKVLILWFILFFLLRRQCKAGTATLDCNGEMGLDFWIVSSSLSLTSLPAGSQGVFVYRTVGFTALGSKCAQELNNLTCETAQSSSKSSLYINNKSLELFSSKIMDFIIML